MFVHAEVGDIIALHDSLLSLSADAHMYQFQSTVSEIPTPSVLCHTFSLVWLPNVNEPRLEADDASLGQL